MSHGRWTAILLLSKMLALQGQALSPRLLSLLYQRNQNAPSLYGDAEASTDLGTGIQKDNHARCQGDD